MRQCLNRDVAEYEFAITRMTHDLCESQEKQKQNNQMKMKRKG